MKEKNPLVSVNIPTYNSARTLKKCLESVKRQTYKRIEIVIIDSSSKDKSLEISKSFNCKIIQYPGALLGARYAGVKASKGKFILLLDSDQILEKTAIERGVKLLKEMDMLWLEEFTYNPKSFLEKLFDADRKLVQKHYSGFISPTGGVILPRFYRKSVLLKGMDKIPKRSLPICAAHDHAIIYYEVNKVSKKIQKLPKAVWHMEPSNLIRFWKKTYRWGKTTKDLTKKNIYVNLIKSKMHFRKFYWDEFSLSFKSSILRVLRGVPYLLGYRFG